MKAIHGHYQPRDGSSIGPCTALSNAALDFSRKHISQNRENKAIGRRNIFI